VNEDKKETKNEEKNGPHLLFRSRKNGMLKKKKETVSMKPNRSKYKKKTTYLPPF